MSYCPSLGNYTCSPCRTTEKGKIRAIAIVAAGAPLPDPSSAQDWYNLICNDLAVVIPASDFRGGLTVEATTAPGYGATQNQTIDFNYTLTGYSPFNYLNNEFFNQLNFVSAGYDLYMFTETLAFYSGVPVNFTTYTSVSEELGTPVETMFEITFTNEKGHLDTYPAPLSGVPARFIFNSCNYEELLASCYTCEPISILPC